MSVSSPLPTDASGAMRRASGRVRKQPEAYTSSPFSSGKRKRSNEEDGVQMPDDYVSDEDVPSDDDEPAEEEVREQTRRARKPKAAAPKKPAQKKPKVNGTSLPIRSAGGGKKGKTALKKTKAANVEDAEEAGGLYADIFASDTDLKIIAASWLDRFEDHESQSLAEVVNFILRCAGCSSTVSDHDVEDPDGCTNRLTDVQEEYQATDPTDYPLIAKGRASTTFKQTMSGFLNVLIKSIAANGLLYSNAMLIDNIEVWFSTMSSAGNRAFRHTATVASLSVMNALCEVAAERATEAAALHHQAEGDRKKARHNKERIKQLDQKARDSTQAQEFLEVQLKDWFDTVFIHRYRDVDPVIRRECASALGDWILILPHMFFDGQHLRYLGWVLSDAVAGTRGEVVKQLQRLYKEKDKLGGLKTFTERFRSRLVEIATSDADTSVRASGIELLDLLRENGLLEPDDIDAVGRLIYDFDARVRKAVSGFFAENVVDLCNSKIDDLGGEESPEEALPDVSEGSFETPTLEWLKFKSLAETMVIYDIDEDLPSQVERNRGDGCLTLNAAPAESRFTLAADALYDKIDEVKDWQSLSGYLLFDHSSGRANGVANDVLSQLKHESILDEKEEFVLLEVVSSSVKHTLVNIAEKCTSTKSKLTKKQKEELIEEQEEAARHLANLIPELLKKFGDVPNTAAAVLRMETLLNLPSLRDLHQDSATHGALLDDIRKQFMSHGTDEVLAPASKAIQHAKSYVELDDVREEKLASLWEDVVGNLAELLNSDTITVRGASQNEELVALSNNLLRITRLSQVSNCIPSLEDSSVASANEATGANYQGAIDYIIALVQRALPASGQALDSADAMLEDEVAARAAEAALRYLQWKLNYIIRTVSTSTTDIPFEELEALATRRDQYCDNLQSILEARKAGDAVCVTMARYMLELHSSAVVLNTIKVRPGMKDDWEVLIMNLQPTYLKAIMKVFSAAEKAFATLSAKKLEGGSSVEVDRELDADPMDEDPLSDSEPEDEDDEPTQTQASQQRRENKQRRTVLAEQTLCELTGCLIFAVHAGVADATSTRKRLERNKLKLGPNFKEICAYLDVGAVKKATKSKAKPKGKPVANGVLPKPKRNVKSSAIVADDEVDDEIEDVDGEDEEARRRRELVVDDEEASADPEDHEQNGADLEAESVLGD